MADTKISALTAATTPLAGTEVLPIVQSGVTKQVSVANLTVGRAVSADSLTLTGSPLPATSGGTGQSSYAVGDLLYASTTTALSKLADVATGNALISGGVGVAPSWGKIGLTTHVSGTLPVANGGTGNTTGAATAVISNATTGVMQIVGPAASSTRVMTIPDANFTVARTDAAQTFTGINTFNSPVSATPQTNGVVIIDTTGSNPATGSGGGLLFQQQNSGGTQTNYACIYGYRLNNAAHDIVELAIATGSPTDSRPITKRMSFDTLGNITISNGNFVQGTASTGFNFTANSAAAGMTSQLLNWYEEGTWTPADNSAATLVFTGVVAQYTRIGSLVTCSFALTYPSTASGVPVSIKGLPFTSTSSDAGWGGVVTYTNYTTNGLTLLMDVSAKTFSVWSKGSTLLVNSDLSSKTIRGVIQYRV